MVAHGLTGRRVNSCSLSVGTNTVQVEGLYAVVAAVLALGNVTFKSGPEDSSVVDSKSMVWADQAAEILQVDPALLKKALTSRVLRIRGQSETTVLLSKKHASDTRDALAKFVYGKMFDWIVKRVNKRYVLMFAKPSACPTPT